MAWEVVEDVETDSSGTELGDENEHSGGSEDGDIAVSDEEGRKVQLKTRKAGD